MERNKARRGRAFQRRPTEEADTEPTVTIPGRDEEGEDVALEAQVEWGTYALPTDPEEPEIIVISSESEHTSALDESFSAESYTEEAETAPFVAYYVTEERIRRMDVSPYTGQLMDVVTVSYRMRVHQVGRPDPTVTPMGLGAVLTQDIDGQERVIAYASRHLNSAEKNYSATERECLAIVWAVRKMREYLEGYHFIVVTDHLSLKWLNSIENPTGRVARWALELQQHSFEVHYRRGKLNVVADALSRQPTTQLLRIITNANMWPYNKMTEVLKDPQAFPEYVVENNQLYRHLPTTSLGEDRTPWKLCVAKEDRPQILQEAHDAVTAGHQGIRKTTKRITARYFWPGMFRDISRYVRACQVCQRFKVSQQPPAGLMLSHLPDEPWATVCADFVGPLPRSTHGHTVLLVLQDKFTKWVELVPLRSATSEGAIKSIRHNIISRFGVPKKLITDNGTQFVSGAFKRALEHWGIQHQHTAPYTPQENAVERANRVVKTMIAQFCEDNQRTWDEAIPEIMLAVNTGVSESTGFSPAYLVQGREPRLPRALFDKLTPGTGSPPEATKDIANRLQDTFEIVQQQLQLASQSQARHYNLRHRDWQPTVGQLVWVKEHPLSKGVDGFAAKLAPKYDGPFEVESFKSRVIVTLRSTTTNKERTAHVRDLKEYYVNPEEDVMSPN